MDRLRDFFNFERIHGGFSYNRLISFYKKKELKW